MGTVVYSMMIALGEMTTLFPVSGSFVGFFFVFAMLQEMIFGCRPIMLPDGSTRLLVLPSATITGTRMQLPYLPKSQRQRSSSHIGTLKPIQELG